MHISDRPAYDAAFKVILRLSGAAAGAPFQLSSPGLSKAVRDTVSSSKEVFDFHVDEDERKNALKRNYNRKRQDPSQVGQDFATFTANP